MPTTFRTHRHLNQRTAIRGVCSPNTLAADYSHWCAGAVGVFHFGSVEVTDSPTVFFCPEKGIPNGSQQLGA